MAQAGFAYDGWEESAQTPRSSLSVSIFSERPGFRTELHEDVTNAGWRVAHVGEVGILLDSAPIALGEAVLLDCPRADAAMLAALARLDMRIARSGAQLLVLTELAALDDIFGCLDQSRPQFLVAPSRAELTVALGRLLGRHAGPWLREFSEEDRMAMLRLAEQVEQLARQVGGMAEQGFGNLPRGLQSAMEGDVSSAFFPKGDDGDDPPSHASPVRSARPPLPDPRLVRRILRQRQLRARFFDGGLFADPAWDILLDLTAARAEHVRVSVSSLCIAAGVPPTTALRWIAQMTDAGLLVRQEDETDRRRAFLALSDGAADAMARYFAELGRGAAVV